MTTIDDVERLGRESGDWRAAFYALYDWMKDKTGGDLRVPCACPQQGRSICKEQVGPGEYCQHERRMERRTITEVRK